MCRHHVQACTAATTVSMTSNLHRGTRAVITRTKKYTPSAIEPQWQARWAEDDMYSAHDSDPRPKYYHLVMFPYPSGDLHIGHWYNYTGADIYGRYMRMRG